MTILVTGGAGYIGSHTCVELIEAGYDIRVIDNLSNSSETSLHRVAELTGKKPEFHKIDLLDKAGLNDLFEAGAFDAVVHFAGLKAVGESVSMPLEYYRNNVEGTLNLCWAMRAHGVKNIVFSSSCTVYGQPERVPVTEDFPLSAANPYGRSKLMIEDIFRDLFHADNSLNIALLRYFNPVGAHPSGRIGEDPNGAPNNLFPYITQVAIGRLEKVRVFGADYPTPDGTGVRDYIHVVDLAKGHVSALKKLEQSPGLAAYNLGAGRGYSVLEMIKAFESVAGVKIPYEITARRPGDIASCYADTAFAAQELEWRAELGVEDMCRDAWKWQKDNPNGYRSSHR